MPHANNELRRRKNKDKESNGKSGPSRKKKQTSSDSLKKSLYCLILSAVILILFLVLYMDQIAPLGHRAIDDMARNLGYSTKPIHAVVIDAGSTGSRVLAFTFHESFLGGKLILDKELFEYTKPGLSSFAKNPEKGVATIANLLEKAKKEIPQEYWSQTPLILKATAGLRLLPKHEAENLLNSVKEYFKKTPFLTDENSVEIMDGTDEGIFSWFTLNFLKEKLYGDPANTVAALDLGGGSTQVTFYASTPASLKEKEYIHEAMSPRGPIKVYTHSYLGLGLMAARKEILTLNQSNTLSVTSECVNTIIKNKKFHYSGIDYLVSGPKSGYPMSRTKESDFQEAEEHPVVDFKKCSDIVGNYVASKAQPPAELPLKTIHAFSYYFDRATESGMISEKTGGVVTVNDFRKKAEEVCHEANAEQPFMCLDLTFIWLLLEKGLGLDPSQTIYIFKKVNGHEISWALGAAYNLLKA